MKLVTLKIENDELVAEIEKILCIVAPINNGFIERNKFSTNEIQIMVAVFYTVLRNFFLKKIISVHNFFR